MRLLVLTKNSLSFQGNLNGSRLKVVKEAFKRADRSGDGVFDMKDLKRVYKVTEHPKYKNGEWDEARVFKEFLNTFEPEEDKRDGKVSLGVFSYQLFYLFLVMFVWNKGRIRELIELVQKPKEDGAIKESNCCYQPVKTVTSGC